MTGTTGGGLLICAGVLLTRDERLLLTLGDRDRWVDGPNGLEIPLGGVGGGANPGEDMVSCARREALEELGIDVEFQHSELTYTEREAGQIEVEAWTDAPAPLIFQVTRVDPQHSGEGTAPWSGRVEAGLFRGQVLAEPYPKDVPGLLWVPLPALSSLSGRPAMAELEDKGIEIVGADELPDEAVLTIDIPSGEDLLLRVVDRFGKAVLE
jgi:8-oxo-dGTP pyrophosphatase MutT (NUDIX family)